MMKNKQQSTINDQQSTLYFVGNTGGITRTITTPNGTQYSYNDGSDNDVDNLSIISNVDPNDATYLLRYFQGSLKTKNKLTKQEQQRFIASNSIDRDMPPKKSKPSQTPEAVKETKGGK